MGQTGSGRSIRQLILVPTLITLAVTIFRFIGELQHWSANWFNTEMGWSIIAILWLVPIFGVYFALRLSAQGKGPDSAWRAIGFAFLGVIIGIFLRGFLPFEFAFPGRLLYGWSFIVVAALLSLAGWPALFKTLLAYAIAARIPVAFVMFLAFRGNLGTHYDAVPSDLPAGIGLWPKYLWLGFFPQLINWVATTIVIGMFFGTIAVGLARLRRREPLSAEVGASADAGSARRTRLGGISNALR